MDATAAEKNPSLGRGCELTYLTLKKTVSESFCRADLPQGRTA